MPLRMLLISANACGQDDNGSVIGPTPQDSSIGLFNPVVMVGAYKNTSAPIAAADLSVYATALIFFRKHIGFLDGSFYYRQRVFRITLPC